MTYHAANSTIRSAVRTSGSRLTWALAASVCLGWFSCAVAQSEIRELVVEETRRSDPRTPLQWLAAVDDLINVGEFELAREYLQKTLDTQPTPEVLREVQRELGTHFFLRLLRTSELDPLGSQVSEMVTLAVESLTKDPARVREWIQAAADADENRRFSARSALRQTGPVAVPLLLQALTTDGANPTRLRQALRAMGPAAIPPLVGGLSSNDPEILREAVRALGNIPSSETSLYLLRPYFESTQAEIRQAASRALLRLNSVLPTRADAAERLVERIKRLLDDPRSIDEDLRGQAMIWSWSDDAQRVASSTLPTAHARWWLASRLADDLYAIAPDQGPHRRLNLLTQLGWQKLRLGIDQPLPSSLVTAWIAAGGDGKIELQAMLHSALEQSRFPSALAALDLLGRVGSADLVADVGGGRTPLVKALRNSNALVRMAAAEAIMRLDPPAPFAGAAELVDVLVFAAAAQGQRQVLIAHPRQDEADRLAGYLLDFGFAPTRVRHGREAIRLARSRPDLELLLVSDSLAHPPAHEVVQQLAFDHYSAEIPICLMARAERLWSAQDLAHGFTRLAAYPLPHDETTLLHLIQELLPLQPEFAASVDQRQAMARRAFEWLEKLAKDRKRYRFYELLPAETTFIQALQTPFLCVSAARVLGYLGTPAAQTALVDFTHQSQWPLAHRQAAAEAFAEATRRSGILLTHAQIRQQYQRYNDRLATDKQAAGVLSFVLDTIEKTSRNP